ncbi:hypothetical protein CLOP_g11584 [Closterium sp. NIES-67]|nr:hypothetical protein CLOP_g11584 [Closterium sp. NIES-67]
MSLDAPVSGDSDSLLPPGFRFHPTDEELLSFYLPRKIADQPIPLNAISDIDMYKFEPWELPGQAMVSLAGSDEWFFFTSRDRKYLMGTRANRMTSCGYWKATGKDRPVIASRAGEGNDGPDSVGETRGKSGRIVGYKKGHVFYKGRAPRGEKTAWVMHEYRLVEPSDDPSHGAPTSRAEEPSHGGSTSNSAGRKTAAEGRAGMPSPSSQRETQQPEQQQQQQQQQGTPTWVVIRLYKRDSIPFQGDAGAKRSKLGGLRGVQAPTSVSLPSSPHEFESVTLSSLLDSVDASVDEGDASDDVAAVESDAIVAQRAAAYTKVDIDSRIVGRVASASSEVVAGHRGEGAYGTEGSIIAEAGCKGGDNVGMMIDKIAAGKFSVSDIRLFSTGARNADAESEQQISAITSGSENPLTWNASVARAPSAHTIASLEALLLSDVEHPDTEPPAVLSHDAMQWKPHDSSHQVHTTHGHVDGLDADWWPESTHQHGVAGVPGAGSNCSALPPLAGAQSPQQDLLDKAVAEALGEVQRHIDTTVTPNLLTPSFSHLAPPPAFLSLPSIAFPSTPSLPSLPFAASHGPIPQPRDSHLGENYHQGFDELGGVVALAAAAASTAAPQQRGRGSPKRDREGKVLEDDLKGGKGRI